MKSLHYFLFFLLPFSSFAQSTPAVSRKHIAIDQFYYGVNVYSDTLSQTIITIDTSRKAEKNAFAKQLATTVSYANGLRNSYTFDSIATKAYVVINAVRFPNRDFLKVVPNYEILMVRPEFFEMIYYGADFKPQTQMIQQQPSAMILQKHEQLPQDFFLFKPNSLEPTRFRCSAYAPIFDMLSFPADTLLMHPRFLIDGTLQARGFTFEQLKTKEIKSIEVFSPAESKLFFSQKFTKGIVLITTKNAKNTYDSFNKNIKVTEETQQKNGKWEAKGDTVLADMATFKAYQIAKLTADYAPIYLINEELETEYINRKTIDIDRIEKMEVIRSERRYDEKLRRSFPTGIDTIKIKTFQQRIFGDRLTNLSSIMYDLHQLRKTQEDPLPIYIVDEKEISLEKLKSIAMSRLEMVAVLEGCDAIQKYGKRGEHGVVIYKSKQ